MNIRFTAGEMSYLVVVDVLAEAETVIVVDAVATEVAVLPSCVSNKMSRVGQETYFVLVCVAVRVTGEI